MNDLQYAGMFLMLLLIGALTVYCDLLYRKSTRLENEVKFLRLWNDPIEQEEEW